MKSLLHASMAKRWIVFTLLLVFSIATIAQSVRVNPPFDPDKNCCDHLFYRSMAYNLFTVARPEINFPPPQLMHVYSRPYLSGYYKFNNLLNRQPPYVYRVVTPLAARLIAVVFYHDNINRGFYTLTLVSFVLASFFLSICLYLLTTNLAVALLGAAAFAVNYWIVAFNLWDFMLTDPPAYAMLGLALLFMITGRRWLFFLACFTGIFVKEMLLFLLPCYLLYTLLRRKSSKADWIMAGGIVLVYLVFRAVVPVPVNTYSLQTTFTGMPDWHPYYQKIWGSFSFLILFALSRMFLSRLSLALLPLALGSLFATFFVTDIQRAFVFAFPFVFLSILAVPVRSWSGRVLAVAPVVVYLLIWLVQARLHTSLASPSASYLWLFVVLEALFYFVYVKIDPLGRARSSSLFSRFKHRNVAMGADR